MSRDKDSIPLHPLYGALACGGDAPGTHTDPAEDPMTPACVVHDIDYLRGGTVDDMIEADDRSFRAMWFLAAKEPLFVKRQLLRAQAVLYYGVILTVGRYFWRNENRLKGEKPASKPKPEIIRGDNQ